VNGTPIMVQPPNFVELKIVETDPGVRGDTSGGGGKPATLETGAVVRVPLFVGQEERSRSTRVPASTSAASSDGFLRTRPACRVVHRRLNRRGRRAVAVEYDAAAHLPGRVRGLGYGEALRLMILAWLLFGAGAFG
jgi:hypothetical protein